MKYAVEVGSGAMKYIPSFIQIGSGIQKLYIDTERREGDSISLLWESRLRSLFGREWKLFRDHS
jgi:hypothetical protein